MLLKPTTFFLTAFGAIFSMALIKEVTSSSQYVIEARVYVDRAARNKWSRLTGKTQNYDLRREINSVLYEVSEIMKTLQHYGLNLRIKSENIILLSGNILPADSYNKINNAKATEHFRDWVEWRYKNEPYDLAMLFTGHNLIAKDLSDGTYGYAYLNTLCYHKAITVLELSGTYMDALAAAHEIGHILGANHDGYGNAASCNAKYKYIMNNVTMADSKNKYFYSSCSANTFQNTMNRLNKAGKNCLRDGTYTETGPRYGTLMTPDQACQRKFGVNSYVSRKAYTTYGDDVCLRLACMTKTVGTRFFWKFLVTPQGMKCGKGKVCQRGKCVTSPAGSSLTSDTCPFGNQPKIEGSYQTTCAKLAKNRCINFNDICCQSCGVPETSGNGGNRKRITNGRGKTADQVCQSMVGPHSSLARRAYSSYGDNLCSRLACLDDTRGTRFFWKYYTAPDGMTCGTSKVCSKGQCIWDMNGNSRIPDYCPYGDQPWLGGSWQTTCPLITKTQGCKGWKETCCKSCNVDGAGRDKTADQVCRELEGSHSEMARRAYTATTYGNMLCSKLACLTKTVGKRFFWNYHKAPDGMACGKNKRCSDGKCVSAGSGISNIPDFCPYGDQPSLGGDWRSNCYDVTKRNGCDGWEDTCCKSCNVNGPGRYKTADQVCKNFIGPGSAMARLAYKNGYGDSLCSKLACLTKTVGDRFFWNYYTAPDGMACGYKKRCSNSKCVSTKTGPTNGRNSCPFGDQPWLGGSFNTHCKDYTIRNGCGGNWKTICCGTCR